MPVRAVPPILLLAGPLLVGVPVHAGVVGDLADRARLQLSSHVDYFTEEPPNSGRDVDERDLFALNRLEMDSTAWVGDDWAVDVGAYLDVSVPRQGESFSNSPTDEDPAVPFFDLTALAVRYDTYDYALLAGKSDVSVGATDLYSPVDRFESTNFSNPIHSIDRGRWQFSYTGYFDDSQLRLFALPIAEAGIGPREDSRWRSAAGSDVFFDQTTEGETRLRDSDPENWDYLLVWDWSMAGADFFIGAHHGSSAYPVARQSQPPTEANPDPDLIIEYPEVTTGMAGFVATFDSLRLHGEVLHQDVEDDLDQSLSRYVLGGSYRETEWANRLGLDEVKLTLEYSRESVHDEQDAAGYVRDSSPARPFPSALLTRLDIIVDGELTFWGALSDNRRAGDRSSLLGVDYDWSDALRLNVRAVSFSGDDGTQFGRWRRNDHITAGLRYTF